MTPRTPTRAHPSGIPTPRPTLTAVLLLGAGGDVFVDEEEAAGDGVDVVVERVALELEAVFVREFVEAAVLEELAIVVKGFKSPEMVKVPFVQKQKPKDICDQTDRYLETAGRNRRQ
jgi:hypothetical protein